MTKLNYKSRNGFTLIELLVVIGILAVLAAIAIPSVAGLIDRANVSADNTNADEMTNVMERFASEYELYCQDIASGKVTIENMDAVQSRVYNVTHVLDRKGISALEVAQGASVENDRIAIYRDTKYPANAKTAISIIKNYTKTSSSTFEPKQSNCNYYYSPDCGVVVCAESNSNEQELVTKLNSLIISGKDAKGNPLSEITVWINLTNSENHTTPSLNHSDLIPIGAKYIRANGEELIGDGVSVYFPTIAIGDIYIYEDYEYKYKHGYENGWHQLDDAGWGVRVLDSTKQRYKQMLFEINGQHIGILRGTFSGCTNLTSDGIPVLPPQATNLYNCFYGCTSLVNLSGLEIPSSAINLYGIFSDCSSLTTAPSIPNRVKYFQYAFFNCEKLKTAPALPNSIVNLRYSFYGCKSMTQAPVLPQNVFNTTYTFGHCEALKIAPEIPNQVTDMTGMFIYCTSLEKITAIPSSVTTISSAFSNCSALKDISNINIPSSVTDATSAFQSCRELTILPDLTTAVSLKNMDRMFASCEKLTTAPFIPNSVENMSSAFYKCYALTGTITINANLTQYDSCFEGTQKEIILNGTSQQLNELVNTSHKYNISVK